MWDSIPCLRIARNPLSLLVTMQLDTGSTPTLRIIISITWPLLLQNKKHSEYLQPWHVRALCSHSESPYSVIGSFSETGLGSISIPTTAPAEAKPPTSQSMTIPPTSATSQSLITTISICGSGKSEIVEINDPFGPTIIYKSPYPGSCGKRRD